MIIQCDYTILKYFSDFRFKLYLQEVKARKPIRKEPRIDLTFLVKDDHFGSCINKTFIFLKTYKHGDISVHLGEVRVD